MDGFHFNPSSERPTSIRWKKPHGNTFEAQLALGERIADTAYRIRYEAYREGGYIPENTDHRFADKYDIQGNCRTTVLYRNMAPVATVRCSVFETNKPELQHLKLQAMEVFGQEIQEIIESLTVNGLKPRVMEIAKLARIPEFSNDINVVFALFRIGGYFFLNFDADIVINAVRGHHVPMYKRFGFQQLTACRPYPGLSFETALMASFRPGHAALIDGQPFLRGISTEDDTYAGLIAGERVPIFGAQTKSSPQLPTAAFSLAHPPGPAGLPSRTPHAPHTHA